MNMSVTCINEMQYKFYAFMDCIHMVGHKHQSVCPMCSNDSHYCYLHTPPPLIFFPIRTRQSKLLKMFF